MSTRVNEILGLVRFNVSKPLQTNLHYNCYYFLTFINDFSTYILFYGLNTSMNYSTKFHNINNLWNNKQITKL